MGRVCCCGGRTCTAHLVSSMAMREMGVLSWREINVPVPQLSRVRVQALVLVPSCRSGEGLHPAHRLWEDLAGCCGVSACASQHVPDPAPGKPPGPIHVCDVAPGIQQVMSPLTCRLMADGMQTLPTACQQGQLTGSAGLAGAITLGRGLFATGSGAAGRSPTGLALAAAAGLALLAWGTVGFGTLTTTAELLLELDAGAAGFAGFEGGAAGAAGLAALLAGCAGFGGPDEAGTVGLAGEGFGWAGLGGTGADGAGGAEGVAAGACGGIV